MLISEAYHWPPRATGLTMVLSSAVQLARQKNCAGLFDNPHLCQVYGSYDNMQLRSLAAGSITDRIHNSPPPRPCFLGAAPVKGCAWWDHEALLMRYGAPPLGNWPEDSPSARTKLPWNWAAFGGSSHPNLPSLSPFTGNRPAAWSGGSPALSCSVPLCPSQMPHHNKFIASPIMS